MLVLIDNYDSFTYNLVHYFEEIGERVNVFRNDEVKTKDIFNLNPDYIVISPGPSTPKNSGICIDLIKENASLKKVKPLLGVCLGHQAIAEAFGANVIQSGKPIHGKVSKINHNKTNLFKTNIVSVPGQNNWEPLKGSGTTKPTLKNIFKFNE